jgi:hypothetical protein
VFTIVIIDIRDKIKIFIIVGTVRSFVLTTYDKYCRWWCDIYPGPTNQLSIAVILETIGVVLIGSETTAQTSNQKSVWWSCYGGDMIGRITIKYIHPSIQ